MNPVNVARHNLLLTVAKLIERDDRASLDAAEDLLVVLRRLAELEATVEALQRHGRTAVLESAHGSN